MPECASLLSSPSGWKYGYREPGGAARWGLHPAGLCWVLPGCRLHPHAPGRCRTPSEPSTSPVLLIMAMRASLLNSQGDQWSFFSPAFTLLRGAAGFAIPPSRRSHPSAVRGGSRFAMIYTRLLQNCTLEPGSRALGGWWLSRGCGDSDVGPTPVPGRGRGSFPQQAAGLRGSCSHS